MVDSRSSSALVARPSLAGLFDGLARGLNKRGSGGSISNHATPNSNQQQLRALGQQDNRTTDSRAPYEEMRYARDGPRERVRDPDSAVQWGLCLPQLAREAGCPVLGVREPFI